MNGRSKSLAAVQRAVLRSARWRPVAALWEKVYRGLARLWVRYLVWGEPQAAGYVRAGLGGEGVLPGVSDIDVAIVLRPDATEAGTAAGRVVARWSKVRRLGRAADALLDYPLILEQPELDAVIGGSALTYGLDAPAEPAAAYFGARVSQDVIRLLERPGLHGTTSDWQLLRGSDLRPGEPTRDRQDQRIAAWLELCAWWQWAMEMCADPGRPSTASLCLKLVAESARIWLWLAHGVRAGSRGDALAAGAEALPEEKAVLSMAQGLLGELVRAPEPPLAEAVGALARFSGRIGDLIARELEPEGSTTVRLAGDPRELILAHGIWHPHGSLDNGAEPDVHVLCDWRTLNCPPLLDEGVVPIGAEAADPRVLAAATVSQDYGPYPSLSAGDLIVLAGHRHRTRLRAVKCAACDPVSFALRDGRERAGFPNVDGWSASDAAARAVAEHRAWLTDGPAFAGVDRAGNELAMLLSAARVALFDVSLEVDAVPELPLTVAETARRLADVSPSAGPVAERALEAYRGFALDRTPPPQDVLGPMRRLVRRLPAYRDQMRSATRGPYRR